MNVYAPERTFLDGCGVRCRVFCGGVELVADGTVVIIHGTRAVLSPSWPMTGWSWYLWVGVVLLGVGIGAFILGAGLRRFIGHFGW